LIIIGGDYTGCEPGQTFRRFGAAVMMIDPIHRLASEEDKDISAILMDSFKEEGIALKLEYEMLRGRPHHDSVPAYLDRLCWLQLLSNTVLCLGEIASWNREALTACKVGKVHRRFLSWIYANFVLFQAIGR